MQKNLDRLIRSLCTKNYFRHFRDLQWYCNSLSIFFFDITIIRYNEQVWCLFEGANALRLICNSNYNTYISIWFAFAYKFVPFICCFRTIKNINSKSKLIDIVVCVGKNINFYTWKSPIPYNILALCEVWHKRPIIILIKFFDYKDPNCKYAFTWYNYYTRPTKFR